MIKIGLVTNLSLLTHTPPQHALIHHQLERFLIDNRDEYLKYSSRNYTVEQKQFNNTLTERLISLAEKHGYIFDPEEFSFVAIRDRIRCYYKSYVQTARKRGIMLPSDKTKVEKERKVREDSALAAAAGSSGVKG